MATEGQFLVPEYLMTINRFPGDGVTEVFDINFAGGYISRSHIKGYVMDAGTRQVTREFTPAPGDWVGPNQIRVLPVVEADEILVLYRDTPKDTPLVDFVDGAILSEANLDKNSKQAVFVSAEVADRFEITAETASTAAEVATEAREAAVAAAAAATNLAIRAVRAPLAETLTETLPSRGVRAGKFLAFDDAGEPTVGVPTSDSATDLANALAQPEGAGLVGNATWYAPAIIGFDATRVPNGAAVVFSGRRTADDGGGGTFTYFASSTQTPDYGVVFPPAAGGGRLIRNGWTVLGFNGFVDPCWYGANKTEGLLGDIFATLEDAQVQYPAATSLDDELNGAAIQRALSTTYDVLMPRGIYRFNQPLKLLTNGQHFQGCDIEGVELRWTGTNPSVNALSVLSGRTDTGNISGYRRGRTIGNFRMTMWNGSRCKNLYYLEDGCVSDVHRNIHVVNIYGRPTEAIVKIDSENSAVPGGSYCYGLLFDKILIRGSIELDADGSPAASPIPIPCGVWAQGIIESSFFNVEVYQVNVPWRFGDAVLERSRNVESLCLVKCSGEMGTGSGRANGTDAGSTVEFYRALNVQFFGCKFVANAQGGEGHQRLLTFGNDNIGRAVDFWGCFFWNNASSSATSPAFLFKNGGTITSVGFHRPSLNVPGELFEIEDDTDVEIAWHEPVYANSIPPTLPVRVAFNVRSQPVAAQTVADSANLTINIPEINVPLGEPSLCSYTQPLGGMMITSYRSSGFSNGAVSISNRTGAGVSLPAGRVRWRYFLDSEIRSRRYYNWDPPAVPAGAQATVNIPMHGIVPGDFLVASFRTTITGALNNCIVRAYCSAPGVATVLLINLGGASRNFLANTLTVFSLDASFDFYNAAAYTPGTIAAGATDSTTVTVAGAAVGDFVCVSFSNDLAGLNVWGEVTAPGTVTVYLDNRTGSSVSGIAAGTLAVGVFKRHNAM